MLSKTNLPPRRLEPRPHHLPPRTEWLSQAACAFGPSSVSEARIRLAAAWTSGFYNITLPLQVTGHLPLVLHQLPTPRPQLQISEFQKDIRVRVHFSLSSSLFLLSTNMLRFCLFVKSSVLLWGEGADSKSEPTSAVNKVYETKCSPVVF